MEFRKNSLAQDVLVFVSVGEVYLLPDDTTFSCSDTSIELVIDKMTFAMKEVYSWCQTHKLTIHLYRSEAMILKKRLFTEPIRHKNNWVKCYEHSVLNCLP